MPRPATGFRETGLRFPGAVPLARLVNHLVLRFESVHLARPESVPWPANLFLKGLGIYKEWILTYFGPLHVTRRVTRSSRKSSGTRIRT